MKEGYQVQGTGTKRSAAAIAEDVLVTLSGMTLAHLYATILPFYEENPGEEHDATLGFSFFKNFVIEVDYENKILNVYDTRVYNYKGNGEVIPVQIEKELGYVNARIKFPNIPGSIAAKFNLDIGSGTAVYFYFRAVNKYELLGKISNPVAGTSIGHGGEIRMVFGRAESVELGSSKYSAPFVGLELSPGGALTSETAAGALGAEVFRNFKVIFDMPHSRMILESKNKLFGGKNKLSNTLNIECRSNTIKPGKIF